MELQVGVKIILQNKEGKFLLLQRNFKKYPEIKKNDSWDIVGGRINIGIPLLENLNPEVFAPSSSKPRKKLFAPSFVFLSFLLYFLYGEEKQTYSNRWHRWERE